VVKTALDSADVVFVQRGLYPMGPAIVARSLERFGGRVVFDLDDAVFRMKPALESRGTFAQWLYGPQQAEAIIRRADAVVVSSAELADALPSYAANRIVLPTVPDPARYTVATHQDSLPVTIGWAGTVGNIRYLEPLRGVFEGLKRSGLAQLEVVSSEPWAGPGTFRRWTLEEEASVFGRFSIGVMPLPDTPYTRAKAGFKLLQYMAAGLPVVASPIGVNQELVERSGAGFVASSAAEWEEALHELAVNPDLRSTLGSKGRQFIEEYANLDNQASVLAGLLAGAEC
jgi:glycosyltransferase involved in cell wall biosynthesis